MRRLIPILLLLAGCTYHRTVYSPLRPEESVAGGEVLHRFTIIRARSVPLLYDHEWDLSLAIPQSQIRVGNELRIPGDNVMAAFSEWHHPDRVYTQPTGTIRFVQVRPDAVQAEVKMQANVPSHWRVNRLVWFRYDPMAATEIPWIHPDTVMSPDR